jgi:NitT/TauT family transport system substrate-binding protein
VAAKAFLDAHGVPINAAKIVDVPFPEQADALAQGRIDAAVAIEPFLSGALREHTIRVLDPKPFATIAPRIFAAGWFARAKWISDNGDKVRRFHSAIARAGAYIRKHPDALARLAPKRTKVDAAVAPHLIYPEWTADLTSRDLEPMIDASVKFKILPKRLSPGSVIAPSPR